MEFSLDWHYFFQATRQARRRHVRLARPRPCPSSSFRPCRIAFELVPPIPLCSLAAPCPPAWCPRKRSLPTDSVSAAPLSRSHPPKNVRSPLFSPLRPSVLRSLVFWRRRRRRGVGRTTAKEGKAKCCHRQLSSGNGDRWRGRRG